MTLHANKRETYEEFYDDADMFYSYLDSREQDERDHKMDIGVARAIHYHANVSNFGRFAKLVNMATMGMDTVEFTQFTHECKNLTPTIHNINYHPVG